MNNPPELSVDNPRANTVEDLINTGLGYCCEWFFWSYYEDTPSDLIAARLGVAVNTVRRHRLWHREGKFSCKCNETACLKRKIILLHRKTGSESAAPSVEETPDLPTDV